MKAPRIRKVDFSLVFEEDGTVRLSGTILFQQPSGALIPVECTPDTAMELILEADRAMKETPPVPAPAPQQPEPAWAPASPPQGNDVEEEEVAEYTPPPLFDIQPDGSMQRQARYGEELPLARGPAPAPARVAPSYAQPVPVSGPPRPAASRRYVEQDEAGNPIVPEQEEPEPLLGADPSNPFGATSI